MTQSRSGQNGQKRERSGTSPDEDASGASRTNADSKRRAAEAVVRDAAYVAVGIGQAGLALLRRLRGQLSDAPQHLGTLRRTVPKRLEQLRYSAGTLLMGVREHAAVTYTTLRQRGRARLEGGLAAPERPATPAKASPAAAPERPAGPADASEAPTADPPPYEEWTVAQLRERAAELDIKGRSSMKKDELVAALRDAR